MIQLHDRALITDDPGPAPTGFFLIVYPSKNSAPLRAAPGWPPLFFPLLPPLFSAVISNTKFRYRAQDVLQAIDKKA